MRSSLAILLFTFAVANATDSTADRLVDRSFARDSTELDNTVLAKSTMRIATPSVAKAPGLLKPLRSTKTFSHQVPQIPHSAFASPLSPKTRGAVVPGAHFEEKEITFNYKNIDFPYEEVKPEDVQRMLNDGWVLLDVRQIEQVERAKIRGAVEVPLYVTKNDFKSPLGIYQEMTAWGLGGWWMGGRPMKENQKFVPQVERRLNKNTKVLVVCQGGLRSKQALKELHLAGFKKLALVKGGLNMVRHNEIPCDEEGCRLDLAGSGNIAGMLGWHSN